MSGSFFLFLPARSNQSTALESVALSWVYEDVNNDLKLAHGSLSDAAKASLQKNITVVLPGEDVLFLTAEVPGKNIQRVKQAVPYALEDEVIDDVDNLYFSIQKKNVNVSDNHYNVSVINKLYLESVIQQLESKNIFSDSMIADYFLLGDETSLFFDGDRILCNSENVKFSTDVDSAIQLNSEFGVVNQKIKLINCAQESNINDFISDLDEKNITEEKCELNPLLYLIKNSSNNYINLLQGEYKKKKDWSKTGKTWLPVAALFFVWLVIQGGVFIFDYIGLSKQNKLLNSEITKIYKKTFPKSRRIIDAKAQMQQKLSSFRKRKGQSGRSFSDMLSNSASVFARAKGLEIKSLRYYDGSIDVEIQISTLQELDKLREKLNKEHNYLVEVQNASSGKDSVTARLKITGAES